MSYEHRMPLQCRHMHLKSPTFRLYVQQLVRFITRATSKCLYLVVCEGSSLMTDQFPHKVTVMWKVCPFHDAVISRTYSLLMPFIYFDKVSNINTSPPEQMAAISQTIFSDAFSWMKRFVSELKFHWNTFLRVQLTITQIMVCRLFE